MNQTEKLLDNFAMTWPNSGHPLDIERFNNFVICSFKEGIIYEDYELREKLMKYENVFTEEQAVNFTSKYVNYIELLKLYKFRENNNWNFDLINY